MQLLLLKDMTIKLCNKSRSLHNIYPKQFWVKYEPHQASDKDFTQSFIALTSHVESWFKVTTQVSS